MATTAILPDMAKRRMQQPDTQKQGRARDTGDAVPLTVELPPEIDQAIEAYRKSRGPTKKWIVVRALEEFLQREGFLQKGESDPKYSHN